MVYADKRTWTEERQHAVENAWPEYRESSLMLSRPKYQADVTMASDEWVHQYLEVDVEGLQQHKQHHVHLPPAFPGGPRKPLAHCRDPKDPM
eukprot:4399079-Amphidinium_carterae.1